MNDAAWSRFKRREVDLQKVAAACRKAKLPVVAVDQENWTLDIADGLEGRIRFVWGDGFWRFLDIFLVEEGLEDLEIGTDGGVTTQADVIRLARHVRRQNAGRLAEIKDLRRKLEDAGEIPRSAEREGRQ